MVFTDITMLVIDWILAALFSPILIAVYVILLLYWYFSRNHNYWEKRGVRQAKPFALVGSLWPGFFKPHHEVDLDRFFDLGTIYGHYEGNTPILSIAKPSLLRDILSKDFHAFTGRRDLIIGDDIADNMLSQVRGEDWKRLRTIVTPTFSTGKLKRMMSIFKECSRTLTQNFKTLAEESKPVDAKKFFGAFTMDVIASSAFSTKLDSHNDPENVFVKMALKIFKGSDVWRVAFFMLAPRLMRSLKISLFAPSAMNFFKDTTLQIMEERQKTGQVRNDFLQLLMDTAKEVDTDNKLISEQTEHITSNYGDEGAAQQISKNNVQKHMSSNELVAQCVIFFLAGYETTATALSYITYALALNLHVQEALRKEVDGILNKHGGKLTYDAVQEMKYMDNVIAESLRLFPPATRIERMADTEYKLGDTGITLPKSMIISVPIFAMHQNPELFPNPEKFDPDRFTPEEKEKRHAYAYLPFGSGPRNCVGMRFALIEIKVCLAYILSQFTITRCSQTRVPLVYQITPQWMLQSKEIMVDMNIREDSPLKE